MEEKGTNTEQDYVLATDDKTPVVTASDVPPDVTKENNNPPPSQQNNYVAPGGEAPLPMEMYMMAPKKQGHKCCGGCCDMRRATMIVNFVNIGFILLGLWYLCLIAAARKQARAVDDDEVQEMYSEMEGLKGMGAIVAVMVVRLVCNCCGVHGAHTFNQYLVGVSLASYFLEIIFALIGFNLGGLVMSAFFAYPHIYLIIEIRAGIMTPENYPREEQSCCCV